MAKVKYSYGEENPKVQKISIADGGDLDAFGRFRVSSPKSLFGGKHTSTENYHHFWSHIVTNSGSLTLFTGSAYAQLSVSGTIGDKVQKQTKRYFIYQPGKSQSFLITFNMSGSEAGIRKSIGAFDDSNGILLECSGTDIYFKVRNSASGQVVTTAISQSNWNVDRIDGTGPSRKNLDFTKAQIFFTDFEWLGVGRVRMGFFMEGSAIYAHEIHNANNVVEPWLSNPNLPVRYEIEALQTTGQRSNLRAICATAVSEGGANPDYLTFCVSDRNVSHSVNNSTITPLIAIRKSDAKKHADVALEGVSILSQDNQHFRFMVLKNPAGFGSAPALWEDTSFQSAVQFNTHLTGTMINSGSILHIGYESNQSRAESLVFSPRSALGTDITGSSDIFVLCAQTVAGTGNHEFYGSLTWREYA